MGVVKTTEVLAMRKSDDSLECLEASDSHVNSVGDWEGMRLGNNGEMIEAN